MRLAIIFLLLLSSTAIAQTDDDPAPENTVSAIQKQLIEIHYSQFGG
ncbi:MAG: hypothetical protein FJ088_11825 [Deltaproteobacteria bacterium]|nr:hypothetical protein [Deltaproteobacteria bacterium]